MACSGQIESHVAIVMEARNKIRESEDASLPKLQRLRLLSEASDLAHDAMKLAGKHPNLRELLRESTDLFFAVARGDR